MRRLLLLAISLALAACTYEDATDEKTPEPQAQETGTTPAAAPDISVPETWKAEYDAAALESGRFDPSWREYAELDRRGRASTSTYGQPAAQGTDLTPGGETTPPPAPRGAPGSARTGGPRGAAEKFEQITPDTLQGNPVLPVSREGGGPTVLRAQILLDRAHFSPGVIDGRWGKNTEKAVYWFQFAQGLPATGEIDTATWQALSRAGGAAPPLQQVRVTQEDLRGPFVQVPEDVYEQEKLDCLCYQSPLEMYAERTHSAPELLEQLNADADFSHLQAGQTFWAPNVQNTLQVPAGADQAGRQAPPGQTRTAPPAAAVPRFAGSTPIARLVVSKKGFYVHALDASGSIVYHFPSTLGNKYDPSPDGQYKVTSIHFDPPFHYQPELFAEVPDTDPDAQIPAGPNSPVGVVWMDLSKPHFGIHGTAVPETIGYTSSHGCIRLTNWDAAFLARQIQAGVPVVFR